MIVFCVGCVVYVGCYNWPQRLQWQGLYLPLTKFSRFRQARFPSQAEELRRGSQTAGALDWKRRFGAYTLLT